MQRNSTYSRAYPCKCLTFGCLATTGVSNFRLHSNDSIRPNTSQYISKANNCCDREHSSLYFLRLCRTRLLLFFFSLFQTCNTCFSPLGAHVWNGLPRSQIYTVQQDGCNIVLQHQYSTSRISYQL
jgi:hypothetical protein